MPGPGQTRPTSLWPVALMIVAFAGCQPRELIAVRIENAAVKGLVSEVGLYVFGPDGPDSAPPSCTVFDPRGRAPGSPEARTGRIPVGEFRGPLGRDVIEIPDLPIGPHTIVIEALSRPCIEVVGGTNPSCVRVADDGPDVIRAYHCGVFDLGGDRRIDTIIDLEIIARIGSDLIVPTMLPQEVFRYDEANPLPITEGLIGRDRFVVQTLDSGSDEADEIPVHFEVVEGLGSMVERVPTETGPSSELGVKGIASAHLRAGFGAADSGGLIRVRGHAAGHEGSPVEFFARAVPNVTVETELLRFDRDTLDLTFFQSAYSANLVVSDLDGDGQVDIAGCNYGYSAHQLFVIYRNPDGTVDVRTSEWLPGTHRGIEKITIDGEPVLVIGLIQESGTIPTGDPDGTRYNVINPRLELWTGLQERPELVSPQTITTFENAGPIEKLAVNIAGRDLDGDGRDELALSGCSYVLNTNNSNCIAGVEQDTDGEVTVVGFTGPISGLQLQRIGGFGLSTNDGSYREVAFTDANGDGAADIFVIGSSEIYGVCGQLGAPDFGFNAQSVRFDEQITFGGGYSIAPADYDTDGRVDVLVTGAVRGGSPFSGIKLMPGRGCAFERGPEPIITGPRTTHGSLNLEAGDFNGDGRPDAVFFHEDIAEFRLFLGDGFGGFADGPEISIDASSAEALALGQETRDGRLQALAVTVSTPANAVFIAYLAPERL